MRVTTSSRPLCPSTVGAAVFVHLLLALHNDPSSACYFAPVEAVETSKNSEVRSISICRWRRCLANRCIPGGSFAPAPPFVAPGIGGIPTSFGPEPLFSRPLRVRGGGYGDPSTDSAGDEEEGAREIRDLIESLSRTAQEAEEGGGISQKQERGKDKTEEEARMWRRLGRRLLDAGERAESARVFRYGAARCPDDQGLAHHLRVYEAFHGSDDDSVVSKEGEAELSSSVEPPTLPPDGKDLLRSDPYLLVSFDVPPEAVPLSALSACRPPAGSPSNLPQLRRVLAPRIVHATAKPVLSPSACSYAIKTAVRAAERRGGFTTDRHLHAPTCDVPSFELDGSASRWVRDVLRRTLFPLLEAAFPEEMDFGTEDLRVQDCFVVRYDGEEDKGTRPGFASLRPHEDESLLSLTVALNDMSEYDGGGLFMAPTGDLLNGDAGTLMCFAGGLVHGGYPVERGTRWILTAFLYIDRNDSRRDPGYVLREILGKEEDGGLS